MRSGVKTTTSFIGAPAKRRDGWSFSPPNGLMLYRFQALGLRRQMAGHLLVQPALDLCSQMNDFDGHWRSPFEVPGLRANEPEVTPTISVEKEHSMSR